MNIDVPSFLQRHIGVFRLGGHVRVMILPLGGAILEGKVVPGLLWYLMTRREVLLQPGVAECLLSDASHVGFAENFRGLGLLSPGQKFGALCAIGVVFALK